MELKSDTAYLIPLLGFGSTRSGRGIGGEQSAKLVALCKQSQEYTTQNKHN